MQRAFAPESTAGDHWRTTTLLNYRFVAQIFAVMFAFGCVGQTLGLIVAPSLSSVNPELFTLPIALGLLACFEWMESRRLRASHATESETYTRASIWITAGLESLAPLTGFLLIGNLIGWLTALGGPPLIAAAVIPMVSILRLDYRICVLQGVLGAAGYWSMVLLAWIQDQGGLGVVSAGPVVAIGKGVLLIGTGVLAGIIAHLSRRRLLEVIHEREEREHVQGQLRNRTADYQRAENIILEKNELISILSHDMRAPLDGVASLAQLMARAPERFTAADVRKYAEEIRSTAHNLRELLDNLVVWAELKSDQPVPPTAQLVLADLVNPVIRIFEPAILARGLTMETNLSREVGVLGDAPAIGAVIRNLVSNAVKYSPDEGLITITTIESKSTTQIALVVTDAGPGMSDEQLRTAEKPEPNRASPSSAPDSIRPTLGLALCRQLLRRLGGSLELRHAKNGGTEARMWLPRAA